MWNKLKKNNYLRLIRLLGVFFQKNIKIKGESSDSEKSTI